MYALLLKAYLYCSIKIDTSYSNSDIMILRSLFTFCCLLLLQAQLNAATFDDIYEVLQEKCTDALLADDATGNLDLNGTAQEVYDALVGVTPDNESAQEKKWQWVKPGAPYKSLLLFKLDNGIIEDEDGVLDATMGEAITTLTNIELETIRQWIFFGCPGPGQTDAALLNAVNWAEEYYLDGGLAGIPRPPAPDPGEGYQIHLGPIFMDANEEREYVLRQKADFDGETEVNRMDVIMNQQSHHFILNEVTGSGGNQPEDGLIGVNFFNVTDVLFEKSLGVWQYSDDIRLPAGTAYTWDENTMLQLDYHIKNYSLTGVLPADVYLNIYTQPNGTAAKEMKSELLVYLDLDWEVPADGVPHTYTDFINNSNQWNIWMLSSHTHKLGTDFDIFRQTSGGGIGEQIYEGFYNYEEGYDVGYYDWEHPANRYFEPYMILEPGDGLVQQATYLNSGDEPVGFGLTTDDEMFISIMQYYSGEEIPYVEVGNLQDNYCIQTGSVELALTPEGGVLEGPGISGNTFNPAEAGLGDHVVTYTYEDVVGYYYVDVVETPEVPVINNEGGFLSVSDDYNYYQWYLDGTALYGANNYYVSAPTSGLYEVVVARDAGCDVTSEWTYVVLEGVEDVTDNTSGFHLAPNPFTAETQITYALNNSSTVSLSVVDLTGRTIATLANQEVQNGMMNYQIGEDLAAGIYMVHLTVDGETQVRKLIKQQ